MRHLPVVANTLLAASCALVGVLASTAASAGPILQGPIIQGPVLQGPIIQGPVVQGPTMKSAHRGITQFVCVTLADGTVVSLR